ncbi:MAG: PASTA domain-containing protein, partial [Actinobacteria bacterium]|nr:PASTA domain-containing protein [Actinomycetota bacterium]
RGLIHRDVKPANLLFDTKGRLRLADFGLARALAEASWTEPTGTMLGTARYASPEQALGRRLDGRSDVYSLALVLVECVTGEVPFAADTTTATLALRTQADMDVPDLLGELRPTIERAGRMDPDRRPDASGLEISLWAAAEQLPRSDPLPLVATLDEAEVTAELSLVQDLEGLHSIAVADERPDPSPDDDVEHLGGGDVDGQDAAEAVEPGDAGPWGFVRTPIVVAEEHHLLTASRPVSFGRVEPLIDGADGEPDLSPADSSPVAGGDVGVTRRRRRPSRRLLVSMLGIAAAAAAAFWWFAVRVPAHDVPRLVGSDVAVARAAAREHGWRLDDDTVVRADGTRPGQVVSQVPRPGSSLAEGQPLEVTVSLGAPLVAVPQVDGRPQAEATAMIADAGLKVGAVSERHDETVPAGSVVSAGPAPGQEAPAADGTVPKGSVLALVVSSGPAPRPVPDGLVGVAVADARAKLAAAQLTAALSEDFSSTVPAGVVISAGTPTGTPVPRGTAVALVVSKGPAPI